MTKIKIFHYALLLVLFSFPIKLFKCEYVTFENDENNPVVEMEYFKVKLYIEKNEAVVFELTELGVQQEILVIPAYVQGIPVVSIGCDRMLGADRIISKCLKKIYIPHTVEGIYPFGIVTEVEGGFETVLLYVRPIEESEEKMEDILYGLSYSKVRYVYLEKDSSQEEDYEIYLANRSMKLVNLIYCYNYEDAPNLGYYWLDRITEKNLYIDPAVPLREGYIFTGWYLEEECLNKWNGIKPGADEEIRVYAGWQLE